MPRADYKRCKRCAKHADDVGPLSHTRLCSDCGVLIERQAVLEQHHHNGHYFQVWRRALAASVGAVLLDDTRESA